MTAWKRDLAAALPGWLLARALVVAAYVLAVAAANELRSERTAELQRGLVAWDGAFYDDIARVGYGGLPEEALRFFPLQAVAGKAASLLFFGNEAWGLVLVANLAALVAGALVHRLALETTGDAALARRSAWYLAVVPPAFVLVWGYAEALFLVASIGCFVALRGQRWWWAAALGAAAALCRPLGVLLVVPAAIEVAGGLRPAGRAWWDGVKRAGVAGVAAVVGPVVGLGAYVAYVGLRFDDPGLPFTVQGGFRGDATDPVSRIFEAVGELFSTESFGDGLHLPFALALVVLVVVAARRLPGSLSAYAAVVLVVSLSADNLNSLERYGLNAFPVVIALAALTASDRVDRFALSLSSAGLVALCALAWLGAYVP